MPRCQRRGVCNKLSASRRPVSGRLALRARRFAQGGRAALWCRAARGGAQARCGAESWGAGRRGAEARSYKRAEREARRLCPDPNRKRRAKSQWIVTEVTLARTIPSLFNVVYGRFNFPAASSCLRAQGTQRGPGPFGLSRLACSSSPERGVSSLVQQGFWLRGVQPLSRAW